MAKSVVGACAQIAILLTICYGSIQCVKAISPGQINSLETQLKYINPDKIVLLSGEQVERQRRAAPVTTPTPIAGGASTQNVKNQYQSVGGNNNASISTSQGGGAPTDATATVTTVDNSKAASATGSVSYNVHNVGVNGTGQRKDLSTGVPTNSSSGNVAAAVPTMPPKKTQLMSPQVSQYPKKFAPTSSADQAQVPTTTTERSLIDEVDVSDEVITKEAANQSLTRREDHFDYYSSLLYISKDETSKIWSQLRTIPENNMLSSSHRRAMTVELKFDFPFYGHYVRNITVATGGFLYTGEYVHSWLAATQYIAPLMANFDTSISDDSFVRLSDNGTAFSVVWENVTLQDNPDFGKFTFSATLHQNGDIVFVYYQLPILLNNIYDNQHPVKVGLSDAYIVEKELIFTRRKTIYEYHRVTFTRDEIKNATIIILTALPTCLDYHDCQACIKHNTTFECAWCPTLNRCSTSTGNDRRKQDWQQKGCERSLISKSENCPALGQKGNNAAQENNSNSTASSSNSSSRNGANGSKAAANSAGGSTGATESTVSSTLLPASPETALDGRKLETSEHLDAVLSAENKNVGVAFGFMVPICLVFVVTLWLFYAYRNPHTRSGQLLIQFRPSQWSWRRGEARYTAATIHM